MSSKSGRSDGASIGLGDLLEVLLEEGFDFENADVLPGLRLSREDAQELAARQGGTGPDQGEPGGSK